MCDFSKFSQFLEKIAETQILLGSLLPFLKLELLVLANFAIFPIFLQFLEKSQKSQIFLGTLLPPLTAELIYFGKICDFSNFWNFRSCVQTWTHASLSWVREILASELNALLAGWDCYSILTLSSNSRDNLQVKFNLKKQTTITNKKTPFFCCCFVCYMCIEWHFMVTNGYGRTSET